MPAIDLAWQAFRLQREAFVALDEGIRGLRLALGVVFLAGLSASFGQSLVLFANRVTPRRFVWSLLLSAVLFLLTYLTWATSTWLVASFVFDHRRPYVAALRTVGLAYVPQLLAFLTTTPYFGTFVSALLSIWTLLAIVIASSVAFDLTIPQAAASGALGWVLWQVVQRTVGRPIRRIAAGLRGAVAGHSLRSVAAALDFDGAVSGREAARDAAPDPHEGASRDAPHDPAVAGEHEPSRKARAGRGPEG